MSKTITGKCIKHEGKIYFDSDKWYDITFLSFAEEMEHGKLYKIIVEEKKPKSGATVIIDERSHK